MEELSSITEAGEWIERHSSEINLTMTLTNLNIVVIQTTFKEEPTKFYEVIIEVVIALIGFIILFFFVSALGLVLFG